MHIFVVFATTVQAALSRSLAAAPGSPLHPAWASLGVVQQTAAKGGAWLPRSTHPATHPQIGRTAPPDFVHPCTRAAPLQRIAIRPAEREHAEAIGELLLGVVVETGEKLHLAERHGSALEMHLRVDGTLLEHHAENQQEDAEDRDAAKLVRICHTEDATDLIATEKDLHFLRKQFLVLVVLCYTVHSMSLHWMFFV